MIKKQKKINFDELAPSIKKRAKLLISEIPKNWIIKVWTENSLYEIRLVNPVQSVVSVTGGHFDRKGNSPLSTTIAGSTFGGTSVVMNTIVEGLFLEFGNHVTTSRIKKFQIIQPDGITGVQA
ncbi:MAG: hypothetical protein HOD28_04380 [Candidatus Marinimicrobia bacterium]|jgi:hypothetical protein|nr:hypothetical protein [Candidatus Neomarinimicrobiota bacterium]MBT4733481.1 hypothetical protein [Candidatus Neomarinimicrobiota bacterium]MBT6929228.1 hypothetical protein [Candidatus Neomarinimicrobiota bacterium]MBT7114295.1 hypothetical protein [Candidatus Neomarinimicrobiota bacterium]